MGKYWDIKLNKYKYKIPVFPFLLPTIMWWGIRVGGMEGDL